MKKYSLYLVSFKEIRRNGKILKEANTITLYDNISFDLAKYMAIKEECKLRFLDPKKNVCFKDQAHSAIGYAYYSKTIASINPKIKFKGYNSDISIYPELEPLTLNRKVYFENIEQLLQNYDDNFFDYSIEAYHIWGPSELIPKGFYHVTQGFIEEGDYYFVDGHWQSVSLSFSAIHPGSAIKETGLLYSGKHNGRVDNDHISYYNQFVIRPKTRNS